MHRLIRLISALALTTTCFCLTAVVASGESLPKMATFEGTTDAEFNDYGIWVSDPNGAEYERVADFHSYDPALSPDGLEIAFVRHENKKEGLTCIELMAVAGDLAGQHVTKAYCVSGIFAPGELAWSPNGYELVFSNGEHIFTLNLLTEEVEQVTNWCCWQVSPTFSPDGSEIAFRTTYNPEEEVEPGIWVVNKDGTGLRQLTDEYEDEPSWSPDGTQIAVAGYLEFENEEEENEDWGGIQIVNATTGVTEKFLLGEDGPWEFEPEWTTDGKALTYTRYFEGGIFEGEPERYIVGKINADGTEEVDPLLPEFEWNIHFNAQKTTGSVELTPAYLLTRYEPRLHYNIMEQYFADSAAEATDGPENKIVDSTKETILAAHEVPFKTPSLSLFAEPEFATAAVNGWIVEGPEYAEDAAKMHANGEYANRAYGRVYKDPETNTLWLDYWFYYYYDAQAVLELGVHEGDWEHVAYRLDSENIPDLAVYSRHGSETAACNVSAVEWENSDMNTLSPNVYVANASHANYFAAGDYERPEFKPTDEADGDGAVVAPQMSQVESDEAGSETALPRWFYWSGRWGNSNKAKFESPESPAREGSEWEDLQAWAEEHEEDCDVERGERSSMLSQGSDGGQGLAKPAVPSLSAELVGVGEIAIRYDIPKGQTPAKFIRLSASSRVKPDSTQSRTLRLKRDHGIVRIPRPIAPGPYLAAASTFSAHKEPSGSQVVPVAP